jgi:5-methylcytosine-specific restriction endonuclease McrA
MDRETPTEKPCSKCETVKPLEAFKAQTTGKFGRTAACRDCENARRRANHAADPEKERQRLRAKYAADPARGRSYSRQWRDSDRDRARAVSRKAEAKRRALKLDATTGDVDEAALLDAFGSCYLCGHELGEDTHLDHVVPLSRGGGHCMANLRPTHATCNLRKGDRLVSELDWYVGPGC